MCCLIPVVANKAYNNAFPFSSGEENNMYNFCCRVFSRSKLFYRLSPRLPTRKKISRNKTKKKAFTSEGPALFILMEVFVCVAGESIPEVFSIFIYTLLVKLWRPEADGSFFSLTRWPWISREVTIVSYNLVSFCWFLGYERPLLFLF